jgi:hypothetical protein
MQGRVFLGPQSEPEQEFNFAFRGRMDERLDNARAVSDKRFLYIRNYMPYAPWMQHLGFLWKMKATQAWEQQVLSGKANEVQSRFFAPKGWTEELYDMNTDPDSVNNLIENPDYAAVAERMRTALRNWQEEIFDSALMPESETVKRADENNTTIYDMVRDPKLYDLPALLDAADLALKEDSANLPQLYELLKSPDCGLRYWGIVGCFLLNDASAAEAGMKDDSHEVRAMAAWLAVKSGDKKDGLTCLDELLKNNSYATLTVLNILDWMGDDARPLLDHVSKLQTENYEARMKDNLMSKDGLNR